MYGWVASYYFRSNAHTLIVGATCLDMRNMQLAEVPPIQHKPRPRMKYGLILVHV